MARLETLTRAGVTIRWTTPPEKKLFAYSYSIVESILTCPVYGLVRYYHRKYWPTKRAMALEAGSAMHEVFAAVRLWQLLRVQELPEHFDFHGKRLFNTKDRPTRFEECWQPMDFWRDELLSFCYKILNTSEFYDDPDDKIRTLHNMEETTIRYVDEMHDRQERDLIWVSDLNDPTAPVGIEQVFDVMVEWEGRSFRYVGTIDGIIDRPKHPDTIMVDENKTASRLDEAWRDSFKVKSQPTGYLFVGHMMTGLIGYDARLLGIKVKQTRSQEDFQAFIEERQDWAIIDWVRSLSFAADIVARFGDDPTTAPQFTHACNRYFRACSFIDLCASEPEDRRLTFENSMVVAPLTPSQEAALALSSAT
jgi:hypothetical protein